MTDLNELTLRLLDIASLLEIIEKEYQSNAKKNHRDRPELGGRDARNQLASVVAADELEEESEDSVGDEIYAHIVLKVELQKQEEHHAEEYEEECRLIQLRRVNGMIKVRELDSEEGVGLNAVAAAREEAADPAEAVSDGDAAGDERDHVDDPAAELVSDDEVYNKEGYDAADKSAHKGHALTEIEARLGVLDIVIHRLEERCRDKSDNYRTDTEEEGEVEKLLVDPQPLAAEGKRDKRAENAYGDHKTVHMHKAE